MCNAKYYVFAAILGQNEKIFLERFTASRTMNVALHSYNTVEKEILAVVFVFETFR